jgi:uncharacterized membrane protein YdbT with pleckstrin-like domain
MPNLELVNYIKSQQAKGVSPQEITDTLLKAGWQNALISEALNPVQYSNTISTEKDYPITTLWLFKAPIIITLISLVGIIFGYYFPYLLITLPFYLIANPLTRKNFHYSTEDKFFLVKQGVISKKQRNLPYGVIQNILVKQDWFDRVFGLATLSVENASQGGGKGLFSRQSDKKQGDSVGSSGNKVNIPGLKKADAEALKLVILQRMKENPLEDNQSGL